LDLLGDHLGLTLPYLYHHLFGVRWSSTMLGGSLQLFHDQVKRISVLTA